MTLAADTLSPRTLALRDALLAGERRALSRAITLVESTRSDHRAEATALLASLRDQTGQAMRVGLSGTPGVGKSTFIESFGMQLIERGRTVAVLAVDPSSTIAGGAILGDKTRMERLVRAQNAFIRPSPSGGELGGVARRTREAILLCEAAGFDTVLVETVGVGQSETTVAQMTDMFLLLLAPAGGDELQGVKRGVMEIADIVVINKADGAMKDAAARTRADYAAALRLFRPRDGEAKGYPMALTASALEEEGLEGVWDALSGLDAARRESGLHVRRRQAQAQQWFEAALESHLMTAFREKTDLAALRAQVADGTLTPDAAAEQGVKVFLGEAG
jgi:LAO/AO transport system kinase